MKGEGEGGIVGGVSDEVGVVPSEEVAELEIVTLPILGDGGGGVLGDEGEESLGRVGIGLGEEVEVIGRDIGGVVWGEGVTS